MCPGNSRRAYPPRHIKMYTAYDSRLYPDDAKTEERINTNRGHLHKWSKEQNTQEYKGGFPFGVRW